MQTFITENSKQTQKIGQSLALELKGGEILCLQGDLGAGKTTFTQGLLKGLKVEGPYTSPTFLIMKEYQVKPKAKSPKSKVMILYHIDAYRINENDLLSLGWREIITDNKNVIIVEWPEKIEGILPKNVIKIKFKWLDKNKREIVFKNDK